MKHFTDHLLASGRISQGQLLQVLVKQLEATPPLAAIVFHNGLLSEPEQLDVMARQVEAGLSYQQACTAAGLWSPDLAAAVDAAVRQTRPGLAEAIADTGIVDATSLRIALAVSHLGRRMVHLSTAEFQLELGEVRPVLLDEFIKLADHHGSLRLVELAGALPLTAGDARHTVIGTIRQQILELCRGTEFLGCDSLNQWLIAIDDLTAALAESSSDWQKQDKEALLAGLQCLSTLCTDTLKTCAAHLTQAS